MYIDIDVDIDIRSQDLSRLKAGRSPLGQQARLFGVIF